VSEASYHETLQEIERQIELTEEFLKRRKHHARYDKDLDAKLRELRKEKQQLLHTGPFQSLLDEIVID
jgi:hypothetical protein